MEIQNKKQLLLEAQSEQVEVIARSRISLLRAINDLDSFGGQDNYKSNLITIVNEFGSEGISLTRIREVLPNASELKDAIEQLEGEGKIQLEKQGRSATLKPVNTSN